VAVVFPAGDVLPTAGLMQMAAPMRLHRQTHHERRRHENEEKQDGHLWAPALSMADGELTGSGRVFIVRCFP
jgi:hypothetical protein